MHSSSVAKVAFIGSLLVFSFLYGFGAREWGWFPNSVIEKAWRQAKFVASLEAPNFVNQRVYERAGTRQVHPTKMQPGVTLITSMWEGKNGWLPEVRVIDKDGQILHRWRTDPRKLFPDSLDERKRLYPDNCVTEPAG